MNKIDTNFLKESIGTSPDEMLNFCDKAIKLFNKWKKPEYDYHPFLYT